MCKRRASPGKRRQQTGPTSNSMRAAEAPSKPTRRMPSHKSVEGPCASALPGWHQTLEARTTQSLARTSHSGAVQLTNKVAPTTPTISTAASKVIDVSTSTSERFSNARWSFGPSFRALSQPPPAYGVGSLGSYTYDNVTGGSSMAGGRSDKVPRRAPPAEARAKSSKDRSAGGGHASNSRNSCDFGPKTSKRIAAPRGEAEPRMCASYHANVSLAMSLPCLPATPKWPPQ
mmetsp:Transcript_87867/g.253727  ORF Transcript_87867/g.253727 Transcript_87867/m.253727 type:complete len:231 (-) Transcript_87867:53-745(-)